MNKVYSICIAMGLLAGSFPVHADDVLQVGIDRFRTASRVWNGETMEAARVELAAVSAQQPGQYTPLYWQGVSEFFLLLYYGLDESEGHNPAQAKVLSEAAGQTLKAAIDASPQEAECHAMLSCVYGFRIAEHPWTAAWMGPRVLSLQRNALKRGPDNPRVHYLIGAGYQGAPAIFRNRDKALMYLERARDLFEAEHKLPGGLDEPRWGYAECLGLLGDLRLEDRDTAAALNFYQEALKINPDYSPAQIRLKEIKNEN